MRVGIDARGLLAREKTGVDYYAASLVAALAAETDRPDLFLYLNSPSGQAWPAGVSERVVRARFGWLRLALPRAMRSDHIEVAHFPGTILPPWVPCRSVVTVYDLASVHFPEAYPARLLRLQRRALAGARRGDRVIAISECTKSDLVRHAGVPAEKIAVIPLASRYAPQEPLPRSARDTLLFVGAMNERKNLGRLLDAYALARSRGVNCPLVLAGPEGAHGSLLRERAARLGLSEHVRFAGYSDEQALADLYARAVAVLLVSLYEGFGLPLVEGMSFGTPSVAANLSSLPEVVGDAGILVDPLQAEEIAQAMVSISLKEDLWTQLSRRAASRARIFSWRQTARRTLEVYQQAATGAIPTPSGG